MLVYPLMALTVHSIKSTALTVDGKALDVLSSTLPLTCLMPTELRSLCPPLEPQPTKSLPSFPSCYSLSAWNASPQPQRSLSPLTLLVSNIHLRKSFHWVCNQTESSVSWHPELCTFLIVALSGQTVVKLLMWWCLNVFPYLRIIRD